MKNNILEAINKVLEIETLGIYIDSMTEIVGPILIEEDITTINGKKGEKGEYISINVSLMVPINRRPTLVKDLKDFKKGDRS